MVKFDVKRVQKGVQSFMVSFDFNKTPITQIADYIIIAASKHKSSDIHFDPREEGMMVRFRMDGDLQDYTFIPKAYERNLTTRLKLMANMNITESRLPQDGAIKGDFGGTYLDMRVSALPTNEGEKIVIRILDYTRSLQGIDSLGFHPDNLEKLKRFMHLPNGIILTTGATGSGKSTTTYSILQGLNKPEKNIITVEDPIEMNIEGINQVQVNAEIGMTFAAALRSILRQDPNIVLIGEIRDSETAQIAVRTAITGHLVLSTIHTNNALSTVERLLDMNVERYLLSTALSGIISQRLAKTLCPDCRYQREATNYEKKIFKRHLKKDVTTLWDANPKGCENCHNGYKGRLAFHEVLEIDDEIRDALNNEKLEKDDIRKMVYTGKTISMLQDALIKCYNGDTSFEEVYNAIEIETEEGDNYEEEMEQVEENAPVVEEQQVSDDLLEEPVAQGDSSVNVQVTIPELEAEKEEILKQMNGTQEGQAQQPAEATPTETQPADAQPTEVPVTQPAEAQPTETQPTETQPAEVQPTGVLVESPVEQPAETQPAVPTEAQPTEVPVEQPVEAPIDVPTEAPAEAVQPEATTPEAPQPAFIVAPPSEEIPADVLPQPAQTIIGDTVIADTPVEQSSVIPPIAAPPSEPIEQPVEQPAETDSVIPQVVVPSVTNTEVTTPEAVPSSPIPQVSIPTVITTEPELPAGQDLQPTTVKPVLQDNNQVVQIPSVTTTTTNPDTIQKLGESV